MADESQNNNLEWLTTQEAADYLRISVGALRTLVCNGKVPYYKFLRRNRYRRIELQQMILRERRGPGAAILNSYSHYPPKKYRSRRPLPRP